MDKPSFLLYVVVQVKLWLVCFVSSDLHKPQVEIPISFYPNLFCIYLNSELAYSLKVSEKSDVYSFGVILLELLTGRSPTGPQFGEGKDIVYWVSTHLDGQKIKDVFDPRISGPAADDMMKVLRVAILCTTKLPSVRPSMREVVKMLIDADPCAAVNRGKNFGKNC